MRPENDFWAGVEANQTNYQNGKQLQPMLDGKEVDFPVDEIDVKLKKLENFN